MKKPPPDTKRQMLRECLRQIFDASRGAELIGASRLARALRQNEGPAFDALVQSYAESSTAPARRRRRVP